MTIDQINTLTTQQKEHQKEHHVLSDSISTIKRSAARFCSATVLSRISGVLRDMTLAYCFGTHAALAALLFAFRFSQLFRRLFGEGALQSAFIPLFEELRLDAPERAFRFFRDLSFSLTIFLIGFIITASLGLFASQYIFDLSPGTEQIVQLMIIFMPSLLFFCLFGLNSSLLQCQKRYFTVGIAPVFFNLTICFGSLFFMNDDPISAMPYVALFVVLGGVLQWANTLLPSFYILKNELPGKIFSGIKLLSSDIRRFATPLALGILGIGATTINNGVDTFFARWADPEGPAQLWYAMRLLQLPLALFAIAISGAILPPLARSIQAGNKEQYLHFIDFSLRRVFAFLLPCSMALYILGSAIVNLLYGRGDFQLHSILTTCHCLHGYAFGLFPMGLVIILAPAFYAHKDFKTPAWGAIISLVLNFVLNLVFIFVFNMNAFSVALATSISAWANIWFLYHRLHERLGITISDKAKLELTKLTFITLLAGIATWFFQDALYVTPTLFTYFIPEASALPTSFISQTVYFAVPALFYGALLLFLSWIMKADDLLAIFKRKKDTEIVN